jgi:hypothetical protein
MEIWQHSETEKINGKPESDEVANQTQLKPFYRNRVQRIEQEIR